MFFKKIWKAIGECKERINEHIVAGNVHPLKTNIILLDDIVTCESCGCAVLKEGAIVGKSEVRTRYPVTLVLSFPIYSTEKYIYTPYYCRACAPKKAGDRIKIGKNASRLTYRKGIKK